MNGLPLALCWALLLLAAWGMVAALVWGGVALGGLL